MFKNIFSFEGRIRRSEYGISLIIHWTFWAIITAIKTSTNIDGIGLFYAVSLWFIWAQASKRCHDLSKNGWWQLVPFYMLWMLFQEGFTGINEYGPSPKNITDDFQEYSNNSTGSSNDFPNSNSTEQSQYSGGYDGGHNAVGKNDENIVKINNPSNLNNQTNGEYNNGDLYN